MRRMIRQQKKLELSWQTSIISGLVVTLAILLALLRLIHLTYACEQNLEITMGWCEYRNTENVPCPCCYFLYKLGFPGKYKFNLWVIIIPMASFEHYINRIEKLFIENAFRINYESYDYSHNLLADSYREPLLNFISFYVDAVQK